MSGDFILAKAFAHGSDKEQAELLNMMGRELYVNCGGRKHPGFESQCCYIANHLNKDGVALLRELLAFVDLRKEDMTR